MSKYQQATRLQGVHYDVRGRNMVEAQRMVAEGQRVLHLNIGNLATFGFSAPESMVRSVVAHMSESDGYADARGLYSARTAVANYYQTHGLDVDVPQVLIGNGVSGTRLRTKARNSHLPSSSDTPTEPFQMP